MAVTLGGVNAGEMDRDIVLQVAPKLTSVSGEVTFDWPNAVSVTDWAQWFPAGTTEVFKAQNRLASYITGLFRMYERDPEPTPDDTRILFNGKVFDIKPVIQEVRGGPIDIPVVARGE